MKPGNRLACMVARHASTVLILAETSMFLREVAESNDKRTFLNERSFLIFHFFILRKRMPHRAAKNMKGSGMQDAD